MLEVCPKIKYLPQSGTCRLQKAFFKHALRHGWMWNRKNNDSCKEAGNPMPEYMIKREDIMVMFKSLVSSLVNHTNQATDQTIPNEDNSIATRILKVIETEPMLSQKKSPILSERNIVRISSSFRTKVILILTHILRQRLLRRQASLPGVLLGGRFHLLDHHKRTIHIRVHKWKFHYILNFSTKDFHSIFCLRKLFINLAGFIRNKAASFFYEGDTILGKGA